MNCAQCQASNTDGAVNCRQCGRPLVPGVVAHPAAPPTPFAPPPTPFAPPGPGGVPLALHPAGFWRRLVALVLDVALYSLFAWAVGLVYRAVSSYLLGRMVFDAADLGALSLWLEADSLALTLLMYLLAFLYFILPEALRMQGTPGKRLLGIRVTDMQQRRVSVVRALFRNLFKPISASCCLIGYLMVAVTRQKRALHDMLSGCQLVSR